MITNETSLLPILIFDQQHGWNELHKLAGTHLDTRGLLRLQLALSGRVKSVVIERHYIDKDYRDTFRGFHARRFATPDSRCIRLHFFSRDVDPQIIKKDEHIKDYYLGYSVIRPTRPNSIGRTFLSPDGCSINNAFLNLCQEKISLQGVDLAINGFPFISQDADVTVCAQSALWMLVRYFSNKYRTYQEWLPYKLASLTRDYSFGRMFPSSGLYTWQMAETLRQIEFGSLIYTRLDFEKFDHLLYTYIESGIPVLATFDNHVVVLSGYRNDTSNTATSVPEPGASFVFTSQFLIEFLGNDDNGYPYQTLTKAKGSGGMSRIIADIEEFIAPLPERVVLAAENAETLMITTLNGQSLGYKALSPKLSSLKIGLRLFLTSGRSFKRKLLQRGMGHSDVEDTYRGLPLPHFIWVCEIFDLNVGPQIILGEILWDATRNSHEPDGCIAVHYPERLIFDAGSAMNTQPSLKSISLSGFTPYPAYQSNMVAV